jgi:hypothetical protein
LLLNVFMVAGLKRLVYTLLNDLYIWCLSKSRKKRSAFVLLTLLFSTRASYLAHRREIAEDLISVYTLYIPPI